MICIHTNLLVPLLIYTFITLIYLYSCFSLNWFDDLVMDLNSCAQYYLRKTWELIRVPI